MEREQTAKEFMEQLENDPEHKARTADRERHRAELEAFLRQDELELVEALTAAGWPPHVRQCGNTRFIPTSFHVGTPFNRGWGVSEAMTRMRILPASTCDMISDMLVEITGIWPPKSCDMISPPAGRCVT